MGRTGGCGGRCGAAYPWDPPALPCLLDAQHPPAPPCLLDAVRPGRHVPSRERVLRTQPRLRRRPQRPRQAALAARRRRLGGLGSLAGGRCRRDILFSHNPALLDRHGLRLQAGAAGGTAGRADEPGRGVSRAAELLAALHSLLCTPPGAPQAPTCSGTASRHGLRQGRQEGAGGGWGGGGGVLPAGAGTPVNRRRPAVNMPSQSFDGQPDASWLALAHHTPAPALVPQASAPRHRRGCQHSHPGETRGQSNELLTVINSKLREINYSPPGQTRGQSTSGSRAAGGRRCPRPAWPSAAPAAATPP